MSRGRSLRFANVDTARAVLGANGAAAIAQALASTSTSTPPAQNKYFAIATVVDGIRFPSKREARRYEVLKQLQRAGQVLFFLRQVPLHLPGGTVYRLDFLVFWADGRITWEDAKGRATQVFKVKKREVEHHYPIRIELV